MPEGSELDYVLQKDLLTQQELLTLIKQIFIPLGFSKIRLTGGEPLLRSELIEIVENISSYEQISDLALTTNGYFLEEKAQDLYNAGLRRINISLDSLNPQTFNNIIGRSAPELWHKTWRGIQKAHQVGFDPLKINVVIIPGINEEEIEDLAALTIERNWHVRYIEFMPIGNDELFQDRQWVPSTEIRERIKKRWGLVESSVKGNGPADVYQIPNAQGTLGFISQMSECFCDRCNRLRLSADGWLRPCLLNETGQIDLKSALRSNQTLEQIQQQVREILEAKKDINFKLRDKGAQFYTRTMSQIGG
jgi:cyclic pyranopterin phosphate synthase